MTTFTSDTDSPPIVWPTTKDVSTEELAAKVAEMCVELSHRKAESGQRALDAAWAVWPALLLALKASGKSVARMGLGASRKYPSTGGDCSEYGPCYPDWAKEPVLSSGDRRCGYDKPKTKAEALRRANIDGCSSWRTIGELWLWVGGGGPVVERAMEEFGYGAKKQPERTNTP